jgi:tetraacyldisaccharide-1-P 4'-kinase
VVIDTNVLLVANGSHQDVSAPCRAECVARLQARQKAGVVVIDDAFRF